MKPNLFTYDDYRKYLSDMYAYLKQARAAFSFRYFAREAGFASSNFLQLVMKGTRNLTSESVPKFCKALKLNRQESDFFENLVYFNQAHSSAEKTRFFERMSHSRKYREINQLEKPQFLYFSHSYYSAVRELVTLPEFKEDPEWIAQALTPAITKLEAQKALRLLQKLNLLTRDASGKLTQVNPTITSGAEVRSLAVKNFHREMIKIAAESLDGIPASERDVSGAMFSIPESRLPAFKEQIQHLRKELLALASATTEPSDRIYQLNIQLFPVSGGRKKK